MTTKMRRASQHQKLTNKPGTAQVGAISKAQKIEGRAFWSHSAEKTRKGDPSLSSGSVGYVKKSNTEAKRCFATHDEDIDYFNMRIYYLNRMRIYSTVQLCSITSLWHSGQHLCRAIGRLQVRISLGFWLLSKRRSL